LIGFWGSRDLQLELIQLRVGQFLVSDVGSDHFLIPTNGRDKVSSRPEFVARKIPHLAFDILRDPNRALPFHVADDLFMTLFPQLSNFLFRPAIGGGLAGLVSSAQRHHCRQVGCSLGTLADFS
jgi:hypothetical protein